MQNGICKQERAHIRTTPGTVNRKEAQTRHRDSIQMTIGMCHQLITLLRSRIQTHRMRDTILFRKRNLPVQPVHTARTGKHQMFHPVPATTLQHIEKSVDITLNISPGIRNRIPHASLCCQMTNPIEPLIHEQHLHSLTVLQIHTDKTVSRPLPAMHQFIPPHLFLHNSALCKPAVFQLHLIIIVDIIQPHHLVSPFQQTLHNIRPDKPGCAGDQYFHLSFTFKRHLIRPRIVNFSRIR